MFYSVGWYFFTYVSAKPIGPNVMVTAVRINYFCIKVLWHQVLQLIY